MKAYVPLCHFQRTLFGKNSRKWILCLGLALGLTAIVPANAGLLLRLDGAASASNVQFTPHTSVLASTLGSSRTNPRYQLSLGYTFGQRLKWELDIHSRNSQRHFEAPSSGGTLSGNPTQTAGYGVEILKHVSTKTTYAFALDRGQFLTVGGTTGVGLDLQKETAFSMSARVMRRFMQTESSNAFVKAGATYIFKGGAIHSGHRLNLELGIQFPFIRKGGKEAGFTWEIYESSAIEHLHTTSGMVDTTELIVGVRLYLPFIRKKNPAAAAAAN